LYIIQNIDVVRLKKVVLGVNIMEIYAISDLHLSKVNPKPMDIFGYAIGIKLFDGFT
jgi:hypothetical protein